MATSISAKNNVGYYNFKVKNYNEEKVSEIGFLYSIEIISKSNNFIKFELYNENEKIELNDRKTGEIFIQSNEKIEHNYCLKILYENPNDINELDIYDEVEVQVYSEQVRKD